MALEARFSELEASLASGANVSLAPVSLAPAHSQPPAERTTSGSHRPSLVGDPINRTVTTAGWLLLVGSVVVNKSTRDTNHFTFQTVFPNSPSPGKTTVVIGSSIMRNVKLKTPGTIVI